jgi:electron transport complex protein RnfG
MGKILRPFLILTLISAGAGLLLSGVYALTHKKILAERRKFELKSIKKGVPSYKNEPDKEKLLIEGKYVCYIARDQKGEIVGIAIPMTSSNGYSGEIKILVGITPIGKVSGVEILKHAETPGLGAKIEEKKFRAQFLGKSLSGFKWKVRKEGGEVDEITGATISSRAVTEAIENALKVFERNKDKILKR